MSFISIECEVKVPLPFMITIYHYQIVGHVFIFYMLMAQLFNNKANKLLNNYTKQSVLLSVDQNITQESYISVSFVRKYNKRFSVYL